MSALTTKNVFSQMNTSQSQDNSDHAHLQKVLVSTIGSCITSATVSEQIIVFAAVAKEPKLRAPHNYFIISLAIADFVIGATSMPFWTIYSALGYWPFSQLWCDIWNALDYALCGVSILTILLMTLDRFLVLKYPLTYKVARTSTKAIIIVIFVWTGTIVVLSSFIGLTQFLLGTNRNLANCHTYYLLNIPLAFVYVTLLHWGVIVCTLVVYVLIYHIATKAGKLSVDSSLATNRESNKNKKIKTITLLLVVFCGCWLPLSVFLVIEAIKPDWLNQWYIVVGYWLGYVNSMLNPICYAFGNPCFKDTVIKMFNNSKNRVCFFFQVNEDHRDKEFRDHGLRC